MGLQKLHSGLIASMLLCIRMAIRMDSGNYSGHSGQNQLYWCYSGLFG